MKHLLGDKLVYIIKYSIMSMQMRRSNCYMFLIIVQVILHDIETRSALDIWDQGSTVYTISVNPDCDSIFLVSCEDGLINLIDSRQKEDGAQA